MVKISLFDPLDVWMLTVNKDFREMIPDLLGNEKLLSKKDFSQTHSDFSILPMPDKEGPFLLKKIKYQKMADHVRRYLGKSQALREYQSSHLLEQLNIACPTPVLAGTNISPVGTYESLFICRYLKDYITGIEFLRENRESSAREALFCAVARDLAIIHGNDLFHKDTNFGNIMCHPQESGRIFWIDNDVKKMGSQFDAYEKLALQRFSYVLKKNFINQKEWDFFVDFYRNNLTQH